VPSYHLQRLSITGRQQTRAHHVRLSVILAVTTLILLVASALVVLLHIHQAVAPLKQPTTTTRQITGPASLTIATGTTATTYKLTTVTTASAQATGLGGRDSLAPDSGMLFSYAGATNRCMWMKGMRFNIDIVWINSSFRITSIVSNVSPGTYPQEYCATAQYVVELPAGVTQHALLVGQIVKL
jgi:uncharacterized membrane protein (UPF0127 family)